MKRIRTSRGETFTTTISSKGQIVLPAGVRSRLGLRKGMRVSISLSDEEAGPIILRPITPELIGQLRGSHKCARGALDVLQSERTKDRERGR